MGTNEERLHTAVRENDKESSERLLQQGVNVDCIYYGMTPLFVAITKGFTDLAVWLLERGSNATVKDVQGTSAFEEAVKRDQVQVVKKLAANGVDVNQRLSNGESALTHAARKKLTYLTQALIEVGGDVNLTNTKGEAALYISAREGYSGVVQELLKAPKVNKDVICGPDAMTPLIAAVSNGHLTVTRILVKAQCDVNVQDRGKWTALWHAVCDSNDSLTRALVQGGADVTIPDDEGRTVHQMAEENEEEDIMEILKSV